MKGQKAYQQIDSVSRPGFSAHLMLEKLGRWYQLHRERMLLASLSDEALKDIGLSRADVEQESERHFWEDPMGLGK
ncbi:DUF1127 domain-containing protein [Pseudomonas fluorescens]|uniref:DUF1127 domain-containing protein n=1 Tax=Pseudomonas fluorescens TaxID=294 RepID=UPI003F9C13E9